MLSIIKIKNTLNTPKKRIKLATNIKPGFKQLAAGPTASAPRSQLAHHHDERVH